eukprot:9519787-Karenia_brevis.AAC.1
MRFKWTVLVGRERESGSRMATIALNKRGICRFATDKCLEFTRECGDQESKLLLKSDQEAGIEFVIKEITEARTE